jgi:hypothetical protein
VAQCSNRETSYQKTMFGRPYSRLYNIKQKYDSKGLFWATPSVGADDYVLVGGRLCKATADVAKANSVGLPPLTDNTNFVATAGQAYTAFPESQAQADKEAPRLGHWG